MSAQVRALRQLLVDRFPDARPLTDRDAHRVAQPVATGIGALDLAFPNGGLPRGKLTAWAPATGAAAVLRAACRAAIVGGERAAWVDASRTLTFGWAGSAIAPTRPHTAAGRCARRSFAAGTAISGPDGTPEWPDGTPLVVHPPDRLSALRSAELLLRSGAFALVVLDGAESVGTETVRLTRAARDGGGAFVALTTAGSMAALRVTSRLVTHGVRWERGPFGDPAAPVTMRAEVRVRALGWNARAEIVFPVGAYDLRCALKPGLDRRNAQASHEHTGGVDVHGFDEDLAG